MLFRTPTSVLVVCFAAAMSASAHAGPPLLCHQIQIGDAKSLPWGKDTFDKAASYDVKNVVDDTLALLTVESPVLARMETLRRATLYIDRNIASADRLLGALLTRTLDAEVVMDPEALGMRYFDAGYLAAALKQVGLQTSFGPAVGRSQLHSEVAGYAWVVRAYKMQELDADIALALALMTADTRMTEHNMFLKRAAETTAADDAVRCDLLGWIGRIRGTTLEAIRQKYPPAHASNQH